MVHDVPAFLPSGAPEFYVPWRESDVGRYLPRISVHDDKAWSTMDAAWNRSQDRLRKLTNLFQTGLPGDVSVVVFGSYARREATPGSDLDWCLLIDGRADSDHRRLQAEVAKRLADAEFEAPNPTGAFGAMKFSHELIHCIGGGADTNANLTLRMLLLLESVEVTPHSPASPHARIRRAILQRYFEEESFFPGKTTFFPRFFLNDVVRFWRTMAVDYAAKTSERGPKGWAVRNMKLRFSRKLLFVAGLLLAYESSLFGKAEVGSPLGGEQEYLFHLQLSGVEQCFKTLRRTPLETLARACRHLKLPVDASRKVFACYEEFLGLLAEEDIRTTLQGLTFADASNAPLFQEVRRLGAEFQEALNILFLEGEQNPLRPLTLKYGIF